MNAYHLQFGSAHTHKCSKHEKLSAALEKTAAPKQKGMLDITHCSLQNVGFEYFRT